MEGVFVAGAVGCEGWGEWAGWRGAGGRVAGLGALMNGAG